MIMARSLTMILLFSVVLTQDLVGLRSAQSRTNEANRQEWTRFRVKREGFSVLLPELPTVIPRGRYVRGPLNRNQDLRTYAAYEDGVVYQVVSFGNPGHAETLDYFEAEIRMNELRNSKITTRTESQNGLQFSFKRLNYDQSGGYPGVAQIYDTKQRVFALVAIGKDGDDSSVRRFLQSFELKDEPAGNDIDRGSEVKADNPAAVIDSPVASTKELSTKPVVLIKPAPGPYTEAARRHLTRGTVVLKVVFSANGRVTNVEVQTGLADGLTDRAVEAAHRIYFIPGMKDGHFVSTSMMLEYNFNIY